MELRGGICPEETGVARLEFLLALVCSSLLFPYFGISGFLCDLLSKRFRDHSFLAIYSNPKFLLPMDHFFLEILPGYRC